MKLIGLLIFSLVVVVLAASPALFVNAQEELTEHYDAGLERDLKRTNYFATACFTDSVNSTYGTITGSGQVSYTEKNYDEYVTTKLASFKVKGIENAKLGYVTFGIEFGIAGDCDFLQDGYDNAVYLQHVDIFEYYAQYYDDDYIKYIIDYYYDVGPTKSFPVKPDKINRKKNVVKGRKKIEATFPLELFEMNEELDSDIGFFGVLRDGKGTVIACAPVYVNQTCAS